MKNWSKQFVEWGIALRHKLSLNKRFVDPKKHYQSLEKQFIVNASHALRTPLAIMKSGLDVALLDSGRSLNKEASQTLQDVREEVHRMTRIVEELLGLSRYKNDFYAIAFSRVNMSMIVHHVFDEFKAIAQARNIHFSLIAQPDIFVHGNEPVLHEMMSHIISNALCYTAPYGTVAVVLESNRDGVKLSVSDTGVGIQEKDLPHVFEPFFCGETHMPQFRTGSGLGLSIVQEIARRHAAKISIESKSGTGTKFIAEFSCST